MIIWPRSFANDIQNMMHDISTLDEFPSLPLLSRFGGYKMPGQEKEEKDKDGREEGGRERSRRSCRRRRG